MNEVALYVSVPIACFRVPRAREYFETFPCPPPATVYGMLLSLVGETNRHHHEGAEVATALISKPEISVVLRTLWRVKTKKLGPGLGENSRPDFQELLSNIQLIIWLRSGEQEDIQPTLAERVLKILQAPESAQRFGGLSLGESTHLLDELRLRRASDPTQGQVLISDNQGNLALPIWPDHVGSSTHWGQYRLSETMFGTNPCEEAWTTICRPKQS